MFTHYRTKGFVLKKENYKEADQLFTVFTKDFGELQVLGKSIRKIKSKLRPAMELFYLAEIEFVHGRGCKILTDAVLIDKFPVLRQNLESMALAYKIAEIFDKLIKGQEKDTAIWQLLCRVFTKLGNYKPLSDNPKLIYQYFVLQLLCILGYSPEHVSEQTNISFEDYVNYIL